MSHALFFTTPLLNKPDPLFIRLFLKFDIKVQNASNYFSGVSINKKI